MNRSSKKKVQPEQKLNSEQKADDKQISPATGNAHVIGGQYEPSLALGVDKYHKPSMGKGFMGERLIRDINERNRMYLQIKDVLKGVSVKDAINILYECRERLEKEALVI